MCGSGWGSGIPRHQAEPAAATLLTSHRSISASEVPPARNRLTGKSRPPLPSPDTGPPAPLQAPLPQQPRCLTKLQRAHGIPPFRAPEVPTALRRSQRLVPSPQVLEHLPCSLSSLLARSRPHGASLSSTPLARAAVCPESLDRHLPFSFGLSLSDTLSVLRGKCGRHQMGK